MSEPVNLVFRRERYAGGPVNLVFGAEDGPPPALPLTMTATVVLSGPIVSCVAVYNNRNPLRVSTSVSTGWRRGAPASGEPALPWDAATPASGEPRSPWVKAEPASGEPRAPWQAAQGRSHDVTAPWTPARPAARETALPHKSGIPRAGSVRAPWGRGNPITAMAGMPYLRGRHITKQIEIDASQAQPVTVLVIMPTVRARHIALDLLAPWGIAIPAPPGGIDLPPPINPPQPPREISTRLVFSCPAYVQGEPVRLVFGRVCSPAEPPAYIVIPVRRTYVVQNSISLYRLPAGTEFNAESFTLDVDVDSWTVTWSASLHSSARPHLLRSSPDQRVEVECIVNGQHLHLVIDEIGRDRKFPEHRIQVSGRGREAELADVTLTFGNAAARTAQQIMADVLTVNGVPLGWDIDWQIADWLVPADAWVFRGSYIDAMKDIAGAAGAYLQPHLTDKVLRVLPRYPAAPWNWSTALTPDIELPVAATSVEGIREVIRPDYNRVFVGGIGKGYFGPVTRTGTAGDKVAPQVNHALITAPEAHWQRGLAVLADTGLQEHVSIDTMLWPEAGIIMPGTVMRYVSDDVPRLGLVRKTGLQMQRWPELKQTLEVETHVV